MSALITKESLAWFAGNFFTIYIILPYYTFYGSCVYTKTLRTYIKIRCFYNFRLVAVKERCVKLAVEKCDDSTKKYYLAYIETIKTFINAKCRLIGN